MKKNLLSLVILTSLVYLASLTSCKKENTLGNGTQFRATMEDCTFTKTSLDGTALNWVTGDLIVVYGTLGNGIYSATPQTPARVAMFDNVSGETGDGPYRAFYPTTLNNDGINITLPSVQVSEDGSLTEFPMYTESNNGDLAFKNICGVLKLHLTKANTNINSISITAASEINGQYIINYNEGNPEIDYSANGMNTTTLTCNNAQNIADGKDFYIYLPEGSYDGLHIEMNTDDSRHCIKASNRSINVTRSQYTLITFGEEDLTFIPVGSKGGLFSIGANRQVYFSQGNLQYQASSNTWRFAEHQYDYVGTQTADNFGNYGGSVSGSDNRSINYNYNGWIDLFGWGTSGWNSGANCYQPWSISTDYNDYWPGNSPINSLRGAYAEADWAWHNAIINGGNTVHLWRTLTYNEWYYLFHERPNASSKYGTGSVNGVGGLIILPDDWTRPSVEFNPGIETNNWTHNSYTLAGWARMEAAGAIFLPAAGYRSSGTNVYHVGYTGVYWSSSPYYDGHSAYKVEFQSHRMDYYTSLNRHYVFSVRPVRD